MNPLHWLADRVTRLRYGHNGLHLERVWHRRGFTDGWTCCLLSVLACYVLYVAGLALLNIP